MISKPVLTFLAPLVTISIAALTCGCTSAQTKKNASSKTGANAPYQNTVDQYGRTIAIGPALSTQDSPALTGDQRYIIPEGGTYIEARDYPAPTSVPYGTPTSQGGYIPSSSPGQWETAQYDENGVRLVDTIPMDRPTGSNSSEPFIRNTTSEPSGGPYIDSSDVGSYVDANVTSEETVYRGPAAPESEVVVDPPPMENPEVATLPEPAPLPVPPPAPAPPQEQPTPAVQVSPEDMALRSARDAWSANRTAATFQQVASLLDPTSLPPGDDVRMYMMKHFGHPNKSDLYGDDQSLSYTIEGNGTATIQFDTESPTKSWPRFDVK